MKQIKVAETTHRRIRDHVREGNTFVKTGLQNLDGTWLIPLDDDVYAALVAEVASSGLSIDACINELMNADERRQAEADDGPYGRIS